MFARTDRLLLRPGWREDAPALFETIRDERIVRNLATAPWPYEMSDAEAFLSRERRTDEPAALIFLRTAGAPVLVGSVGLGRLPDGDVELGYWIAPHFWGRGFATEAASAMIHCALHALRLERLVAGHFVDNPASGRVLAKLGFVPTGQIEERHSVGRGRADPCRMFVLEARQASTVESESRLAA